MNATELADRVVQIAVAQLHDRLIAKRKKLLKVIMIVLVIATVAAFVWGIVDTTSNSLVPAVAGIQ